jgi:hypothetical protein
LKQYIFVFIYILELACLPVKLAGYKKKKKNKKKKNKKYVACAEIIFKKEYYLYNYPNV